jgi:hypothetical protein
LPIVSDLDAANTHNDVSHGGHPPSFLLGSRIHQGMWVDVYYYTITVYVDQISSTIKFVMHYKSRPHE